MISCNCVVIDPCLKHPPVPSRASNIIAYIGKEDLRRINPRIGRWREVIHDVAPSVPDSRCAALTASREALIPLDPPHPRARRLQAITHGNRVGSADTLSWIKITSSGTSILITHVLDLLTVGC
jgi:hypothetical protein